MRTTESIPPELRPPAEAAVSWINETQLRTFELTGLVDYDQALELDAGEGYELGLVLCDGEVCVREQVRVQPGRDGYEFRLVESGSHDIPPLLDPPQGVRRQWLAGELAKHEMVLLLFYRGLW